ncbi:MAG TPA: hypothetical protein VLT59_06385 [Steroidobacteraceae bacterium]|nr:hypothetical protein [Steroidobacteraceae bacterium]
MDIDWLQWAAALATIVGAFFVGSTRPSRRVLGFIVFGVSNVLWIFWGWPRSAWGLITLQVALMGLNARGLLKNESPSQDTQPRSKASNAAP